MSFQQVIVCLDKLVEYPAIVEYIKSFNGEHGFMYTTETDPVKIDLQKRMNQLLDDDTHSGASWGYMMRLIQAVLNGVTTRENILESMRREDAEEKQETASVNNNNNASPSPLNENDNSLYNSVIM